MIRPVSHPETGRQMDIAAATPGDIAFLADLYANLPARQHGLTCDAAGGTAEDRQVYVYKRDDSYWCRHFRGYGHEGTHRVIPESDAHKRGKDYGLDAFSRAGIPAGTEISSNRKTRSDIVGFGGVVIAAEIQATSIKTQTVKARDTRARRATAITTRGFARSLTAGIQPVWTQIHDGPAAWLHQVPSIRSTIRSSEWANRMPKPGTVGAAGVRSIDPEPCRAGSRWDHCPVTGRNYCGSWHPYANVRTGLTLDDVFVQAACGLLVPFGYYTGHVYLTDAPASIAVYAELGGNGTWEPGTRTTAHTYGIGECRYWIHPEQECASPAAATPAAAFTAAMNAVSRAAQERRETIHVQRMEPCEACGELIDRASIDGRIHVATCRSELLGRWRHLPTAVSTITPPPPAPIRRAVCYVCGAPARLYPAGYLCDRHRPQPARQDPLF